MKLKSNKFALLLSAAIVASTASQAAVFFSDFNSGFAPSGSQTFGNAFIDTTGGATNSGVLKITTAFNGQSGAFLVNDIAGGNPVTNFLVTYKLNLGGAASGGQLADGLAFCYATDLPNAGGEEGAGSGLIISFDTYDNLSPDSAPAIEVKYNGSVLACASTAGIRNDARARECGPVINDGSGNPLSLDTSNTFANVSITLHDDGTLDLSFKDVPIFTGVVLNGFTPFAGGRFGWYGRTGGLNEDAFIDNLLIAANYSPGPVTITDQPADVTVTESQTATFSVGVDGTPPFSIQWFSNNVAIAGANGTSYSTATTLGMNGTHYRADITNPVSTSPVSTRDALLTVNSGTLVTAVTTKGQLATVYVSFNKGVKKIGNYTIDGLINVNSVAYGSSHSEIILHTDPLTPETTYNLTVAGEQGEDNSVLVPDPTTVAFREGYGAFCANFDDNAVPAGAALGGGASVGGAGGDGILHLTDDGSTGACGELFISDRNGGLPLANLRATWLSQVYSGGSAADGYSFNWGPDVPAGCNGSEEGVGSGLSVTVDTYDNGCNDCPTGTDTGLEIKWKGQRVAYQHTSKAFLSSNGFVNASVTVTPSGVATFSYNGITLTAPLAGFGNGIAGGNFSFVARTGGASENAWIDNLCINDFTVGPIFFTLEPVDTTTGEGQPTTFTAAVDGSPPYYFQWRTNGTAVAGANSSSFTIPVTTAAMEGMQVSVIASNDFSNVTSSNATLHVQLNPRVLAVFTTGDCGGDPTITDVHVLYSRAVDISSGNYDITGGNFVFERGGRFYGSSHSEAVIPFDVLSDNTGYTLTVSDVVAEGGALTLNPNPTIVNFHNGFGSSCPDFSSGTPPPGTTLAGNATISGGFLHITDAANGQSGQFTLADQNGGAPIDRLLIKFQALVGSPTPLTRIADGFSVNLANDLGTGYGEDGTGSGLTISFDSWDNAGTDTAPAFEIRYKGGIIATQSMDGIRDSGRPPATPLLKDIYGNNLSLETSNAWGNVSISVSPAGKVDVYYKDYVIFHNVQLPNYTPFVGATLGIGGRTGGANENAWISNLCINAFSMGPVLITGQPADSTINELQRIHYVVGVDGLPPYLVQWYSNNVAIPGADALAYSTPPLNRSANGAGYYAAVSNFCGWVTSRVAVVTIIPDSVVPHVTVGGADCNHTNIVLSFDKQLDPTSANNAGNYTLNNGHTVTSAVLQADGTTVVLTVSPPLNVQDAEFVTVSGVKDSTTFNSVVTTKAFVGVKPDLTASGPQNLIVFEAEDYDLNMPFTVNGIPEKWQFNNSVSGTLGLGAATGTFSGSGDMEAVPNGGNNVTTLSAPRMDYCVNLSVSGTWYVWVRYVGPTGADDSLHVGVDGGMSPLGLAMGNNGNANRYEWNNFTSGAGGIAQFTVASAGRHTFNIWMREDGTRVDKILLTTDPSYTFPDITVLGPDSTVHSGDSKLTIVNNQPVAGAQTISWPGAGWTLQAAAGLKTPPALTGWQNQPFTSPVVIPPGFFGSGKTNVEFRLISQ